MTDLVLFPVCREDAHRGFSRTFNIKHLFVLLNRGEELSGSATFHGSVHLPDEQNLLENPEEKFHSQSSPNQGSQGVLEAVGP
uniref:Uncharacterized protein n=1 Tax=Oryzias sinensis TaxID=183150 RepID=A0A8C7WVM9_9TELE